MRGSLSPRLIRLDARLFAAAIRPPPAPLLAVDPGTKHVGVAVTDPRRERVYPFAAFERRSAGRDAKEMRDLLLRTRACGLVWGYPLDFRNEQNEMTGNSLDFLISIHQEEYYSGTELDAVLLWNEVLSTVAVKREMGVKELDRFRRGGFKNRRTKAKLDMGAASYMLQEVLNHWRHSKVT